MSCRLYVCMSAPVIYTIHTQVRPVLDGLQHRAQVKALLRLLSQSLQVDTEVSQSLDKPVLAFLHD